MIKIEAQLHGYSHGHEMLAASMALSKADQTVIDRLSDVAGPLRSGETFAPYLSTYPLPSGGWNVLARTWPDDTVSRPGCVRTLSLLIPAEDWAKSTSLLPFLTLLAKSGLPSSARAENVPVPQPEPLPPAQNFSGNELLEALFLEESRPVAVFDAPDPELIAMRLLSAMWPSLRRRFALSTFALSPRRIEGRDFNLVFAPKTARQKFADWPGRRVDGNAKTLSRHRWTDSIVDRVFTAPFPRLLDEGELQSDDIEEGSTGARLRISLLWDELREKLDETPTAALGLLDIARTRPSLSPFTESTLREAVKNAAKRAIRQLPAADAWALVGAMTRKLRGTALEDEVQSLQAAANTLASMDPMGGLMLLANDESLDALSNLVAPIAYGLAESLDRVPSNTLTNLPARTVLQLISQAQPFSRSIATSPRFQSELIEVFDKLRLGMSEQSIGQELYVDFRNALLPFLTQDFQAPLACRLIETLDANRLVQMTREQVEANGFAAQSFVLPMVRRARALNVLEPLREQLILTKEPARRRDLISLTLEPCADDIKWLIEYSHLQAETSTDLLVSLLQGADDRQFRELLGSDNIREWLLQHIPATATQLLRRLLAAGLPLDLHVWTANKALEVATNQDRIDIAFKALERCLRDRFSGNEVATVSRFLGLVGAVLNPGWAISHGIDNGLDGDVISRNLLAFELSEPHVRSKIVSSVGAIAAAFEGRWSLDLNIDGAKACANLFWSARQQGAANLLPACGQLMNHVLRSKGWPVSSIIPATFPVVYIELATHDEVPDILKIVPFFDWDKCKSARQELVRAFLSSQTWKASDFAFTAYLCPHSSRFLRRVARTYGGNRFLDEIEQQLDQLPEAIRSQVLDGLQDARSKRW